MPRERSEFFRDNNIKEREKLFVLAFEGNCTEEKYFNDLIVSGKVNEKLYHIYLLTRSKDDTNSAPIHVFKKLKDEIKEEFNLYKSDELWMIIDRDKWTKLDELCTDCKKENIFLAVSTPCFELWLLLHLKDISEYNETVRQKIIENKKTNKKRRYIEYLLINELGSYNKKNIKTEIFINNILIATERAKKIDNPNENYPYTLGSHIYKLIEKII